MKPQRPAAVNAGHYLEGMAMSNLKSDGENFPTESLQQFRRRLHHTRAMLRSVMMAIKASEDGSVNFSNGGYGADVQRWGPVTAAARSEMIAVRDTSINSPIDSPAGGLDWVTPLAQIEALDAALWHSASTQSSDRLESFEVFDAAEAIVNSLDGLLEQAYSSAGSRAGQVATAVAH